MATFKSMVITLCRCIFFPPRNWISMVAVYLCVLASTLHQFTSIKHLNECILFTMHLLYKLQNRCILFSGFSIGHRSEVNFCEGCVYPFWTIFMSIMRMVRCQVELSCCLQLVCYVFLAST